MEFSTKLHTIKSGRSIVHNEGSHFIIEIIAYLSLKIDFVIANSANSDELSHSAAFHLGLYCLSIYQFRGFWSTKG